MRFLAKLAALLVIPAFAGAAALKAKVGVKTQDPGIVLSPMHYGIFFEEINRAGDGGIYAEMLQNRSFEDSSQAASAWAISGDLKAALDTAKPLNAVNTQSLRLEFGASGGTLANAGFSREAQDKRPAFAGGLRAGKGEALNFSAYVRGSAQLKVQLRDEKEKVLAESPLPPLGPDWAKVQAALLPSKASSKARLLILGKGPGTAWIDQVSLMPAGTWKGHGLRKDLAELVEAMRPGFVRFPGGCFVEGNNKQEAIKWKESIGDPASRQGTWNLWGYKTTGGFGVHEFLQWCEDLGAEPLYVINCGMGHGYALPMGREMDEKVQDALDLLEYARGPVSSRWGAKRAAAGRAEPFKLNYIEIGNENGGKEYEARHALMVDAIRKAWPGVKIVTGNWGGGVPKNRKLDLVDEHYYLNPEGMAAMAAHYDGYDRKGPKVYVGEYAVTQDCGMGNLKAALAEAAFMTGMERNADVVRMSSYAPLFVHPAWRAWNPNAIVFDQSRAYGTPSYHVQALFAANRPHDSLPMSIVQPKAPYEPPKGYFGLASWETQVEYKDFRFTAPDGTLAFAGDFEGGLKGWKVHKGDWKAEAGVLSQSSLESDCVIYVEGSHWGDGTLSLKARKKAGREGFQIMFQADDVKAHRFWNLGGWGNTVHCIESAPGQPKVPGRIEAGRWYELKIELKGPDVRCYLDGKLVQELERGAPQALYASAGRSADGGELIVKLANLSGREVDAEFDLPGVKAGGAGRAWTLSSKSPEDENSFEAPHKVAPKESAFRAQGPRLSRKIAPYCAMVMRLELAKGH